MLKVEKFVHGAIFLLQIQMHKQPVRKPKTRNWTEIAQDIGHVLRNQLVDRRQHQSNPSDLRRSAVALTKSILKAEKLPAFPMTSEGKLLFQNKRLKTEPMTLKYARQTYMQRKDSFDGSSGYFDFTNPQKESRISEMQQNKKKDAEMMRAFLGRLRQERAFSKIYNQREKSYKIWRLRADKLVANSQK